MQHQQGPRKAWYEHEEWPEQSERARIGVILSAFCLAPFWVLDELVLGFHDGWAIAATVYLLVNLAYGSIFLLIALMGSIAAILRYRNARRDEKGISPRLDS